jgi:hypothetical protein
MTNGNRSGDFVVGEGIVHATVVFHSNDPKLDPTKDHVSMWYGDPKPAARFSYDVDKTTGEVSEDHVYIYGRKK